MATGGAAGASGAGGACVGAAVSINKQLQPADIVWIIDGSASMVEEATGVEVALNQLVSDLAKATIDARVVLLGATKAPGPYVCLPGPLGSGNCSCPPPPVPCDSNGADSKPPGYTHVPASVGSVDALQVFMTSYPKWKQVLRVESSKTLIVVTDDNSMMSAQAFLSQWPNTDSPWTTNWVVSGIFGRKACVAVAAVGSVYEELVTQTKGTASDICDANGVPIVDFKPVLASIGDGIIKNSTVDCKWSIPPGPSGVKYGWQDINLSFEPTAGVVNALKQVANAAACGIEGGWFYDNPTTPEKIEVCASTCAFIRDKPQGKLSVLYGCPTRKLTP